MTGSTFSFSNITPSLDRGSPVVPAEEGRLISIGRADCRGVAVKTPDVERSLLGNSHNDKTKHKNGRANFLLVSANL